ncbi:MAG: hypothetical protein WAQ52_12820 [Terriglobales bacterium]
MESLNISVHVLEDANRKLELLLDILRPAQASFSLTAEHMAAALAEVLRVGEWLRAGLAQSAEGPLAQELERYRLLLADLRQLLPSVHAQLLTERSRLQAERAHLEATAAWAKSARGQGPS